MPEAPSCQLSKPDSIEQLLKRIARRAFVGTLISAWPMGCTVTDQQDVNEFDPLGTARPLMADAAVALDATPTCIGTRGRFIPDPSRLGLGDAFDSVTIDNGTIVTKRGDEVQVWAGSEPLRALMAPIETLDEAAVLMASGGFSIRCSELKSVGRLRDGTFEATVINSDASGCGSVKSSIVRVSIDGILDVLYTTSNPFEGCSGRRPAQLVAHSAASGITGLGRYLAEVARLEEASIAAFEILARELEELGAPSELVQRAREARDDEVRHAQTMTALARLRGGLPARVIVSAQPTRSLLEIALENVVEGCVRETYGALLGAHQAAYATDRALRDEMARIASDEARHASLSHDVHRWLMAQLDETERAQVYDAQREAMAQLARDCAATTLDDATREAAGLPRGERALELFDELERALWAPALAPGWAEGPLQHRGVRIGDVCSVG